jgi:prepilin-type N-terminal cleavage/methylation domain-containing protein
MIPENAHHRSGFCFHREKNAAFTLIELLVVIAIICGSNTLRRALGK